MEKSWMFLRAFGVVALCGGFACTLLAQGDPALVGTWTNEKDRLGATIEITYQADGTWMATTWLQSFSSPIRLEGTYTASGGRMRTVNSHGVTLEYEYRVDKGRYFERRNLGERDWSRFVAVAKGKGHDLLIPRQP